MGAIITVVVAFLVASLAGPAFGQPRVTNGHVQPAQLGATVTRAAIDAFATRAGTAWLAYSVPLVEGDHSICDGMSSRGSSAMQLERGGPNRRDGTGTVGSGVMMLEGPRQLWVLYRTDGGRIDRIRVASEECTLDAGGLTIHWIANVPSTQSVALLTSFLSATTATRLADGALTALAMHREPAALEQLLTTARDGGTTHLRGQALFWLAQRAGEKAVGAIDAAIANDPETEVKRRAVFALSQLPRDEGVPRLIEVARTNGNPAVRKQAMFWLGQSRDPRAVKFFQEVLFNK